MWDLLTDLFNLGEGDLKWMWNVKCEHPATGRQEDVMKTTRTIFYVSQRAWHDWCNLLWCGKFGKQGVQKNKRVICK